MKVKLDSFLQEISERTTENNQYPVLTSSKSGLFLQSEYFNKQVASKDNTGYKIIRRGQFTYRAMSDTGEFFPNILECTDVGIVSPAYPVFSISKADVIVPHYLKYYFKSNGFQKSIAAFAQGSTRTSVKFSKMRTVCIDLPSIEKQKGVVAVLDKINNVILSRQQQLQKLDELVKARFVEMFGDAENGESKFPLILLGDLATKISDGVHAKPQYTESGRPFLSVVNINQKKVDFTDCKFVSEEAYQKMIKSTHPEKGDVLYTKVGATYGIPAYVDTDIEFCLYVSVCLIKPDHHKINSKFLAIQMDTPFVKHQADKRIKGIGVPDLHLNQIREFLIVCPPRELQDEFVDFVNQLDKSKFVVQQALEKAQLLFDSLMQQYFG